MTTEIILVELDAYENNLTQLLTEYESVHDNYIKSLNESSKQNSKILLSQLSDINNEILSLMGTITEKIDKMDKDNKYRKYKDTIDIKKQDLNTLNAKMVLDERRIKQLMFDTIDLNGQNENLRVQHKSSVYYNLLYMIFIIVLGVLIFRTLISVGTNSSDSSDSTLLYENIFLFLAISLLLYMFRYTIYGWFSSLGTSVSNAGSDTSSWFYRLLH
jgi:hypothetical protein